MLIKFILAMLPIIWLIVALTILKMPGWKACVAAFVIAVLVGGLIWHLPPAYIATASLEGALNALWPICLVIISALFTYNLTLETGAMEKMKAMLSGVSMDRRVLFLLIGYGFGNFMEGMAGFGTAVAIPTGILVSLGFDPISTIIALLVVNSTPTAFGSVGVPTQTLASVAGVEVMGLTTNILIIEAVLMFISPFLMVAIANKSFQCLKGMWGLILISDIAFLVPAFIVGHFAGPELPNVIGSIFSMISIVAVVTLQKNKPIPEEYLAKKSASGPQPEAAEPLSVKEMVVAWMPFILIFVFLLLTSLVPFIKEPLSRVATQAVIYSGPDASPLTFSWLTCPGVIIILAAYIGGAIQGASPGTMTKVLGRTIATNWKTILTICSVLATAKIMSHSGMTGDIATFFVSTTGTLFPLFSPLIGVLGGFITGSGTSTNVLFGEMQAKTAEAIGSDPSWLAAANVMGAGIGKMICPQGIAIGTSAAKLTGAENKILGGVLKYCILYFVVGGILCYLIPMVF